MEEDRLALCAKISQIKWIESLKSGTAWFGKIDNYIRQAIVSGNEEQGDRYEGIFARRDKNDPLIEKYKNQLGDDLEIIPDGAFCFLRRKSSRVQKAFCMYGIKTSDFEVIEVMNSDSDELKGKVHCHINPRMYDGFLQDGSRADKVVGFYCSAGHINEAIEKALKEQGYKWKRAMVQYDIDLKETFLIKPADEYPELWHKRKELEYQHESRIIIYDKNDTIKGIPVKYEPLTEHSGNLAIGQLCIEGTAFLTKKRKV